MSSLFQDALELLGVIAVIVNCCLVGVFGHTKRLAPELDESCIFILIVILEVSRTGLLQN